MTVDLSDSIQQFTAQNVSVNYGAFSAVKQASFSLKKGEIACLLGPSGCGKTSLLRAIAGFEPVHEGTIALVDKLISSKGHSLSPDKRRVGMVFQDYALFPHLDVAKNIGFGLADLLGKDKTNRINEMLRLVGLAGFENKLPSELSGGQQQRVALARALAPKPDLLLLDEPFSSLDSELREKIAEDVRALLKKQGTTALLVTHDQLEAFAVADSVGVMRNGEILQWDTPYNLYHQPVNRFVAGFVGDGALIELRSNDEAQIDTGIGIFSNSEVKPNTDYELLIRPDDVRYDPASSTSLLILAKRFRGADNFFDLRLPEGQKITCVTASHINPPIGENLPVRTDLKHLILFPKALDG